MHTLPAKILSGIRFARIQLLRRHMAAYQFDIFVMCFGAAKHPPTPLAQDHIEQNACRQKKDGRH